MKEDWERILKCLSTVRLIAESLQANEKEVSQQSNNLHHQAEVLAVASGESTRELPSAAEEHSMNHQWARTARVWGEIQWELMWLLNERNKKREAIAIQLPFCSVTSGCGMLSAAAHGLLRVVQREQSS